MAGQEFKLMIDCGVVLGTKNPEPIMTRIVKNIVADTGGIDILAITHEHWDHLSGFIQAKDAFKGFDVGEVWVAWTEDPHDKLASELKQELGKAEQALVASEKKLQMTDTTGAPVSLRDLAAKELGAAASSKTSTKAAFEIAKAMAPGKRPRLCRPDDEPYEIEGFDARIYVLGPPHDPTLIRKINPSKSAPETYALALDGGGVMPAGVFSALLRGEQERDDASPFHPRVMIPLGLAKADKMNPFFAKHYFGADDWRRIDGDWIEPANSLALALQSYTNNTSLVLAIELGPLGSGNVLLFAGDAQVGNWESWQQWKWPLNDPRVTGHDLLARTIFYKVGHHGSHNATLRQHGLEEMLALKAAIIPVDEVMAKAKHWGHMPLPSLLAALRKKVTVAEVIRTDKPPAAAPPSTSITKDYVEVSF
jgi:beta-lactamase superfamily II metal-dependent hydrolase